jgi:hypothetical protein
MRRWIEPGDTFSLVFLAFWCGVFVTLVVWWLAS